MKSLFFFILFFLILVQIHLVLAEEDTQNTSTIVVSTITPEDFVSSSSSSIEVVPYIPVQSNGMGLLALIIFFVIIIIIVRIYLKSKYKVFKVKILKSGEVIVNKKSMGITEELRFDLHTRSQLSIKINGNISKIVTSIQQVPFDNQYFVITLAPDNREHNGIVVFTKKIKNIKKYKIRK